MSVRKEMAIGVFWGAVQKYSGIVIQLVITAILARLLSPADFGVIAIATILINFFNMFTDMGIGPAIIQNRSLTEKDLESIFLFTLCGGLLLSMLFFGMARPIALYFRNESIVPICRILSVNLFFASCNIVPNALINKNKRFRFIAERTLGLQVAGGLAAVAAAYHGAGFYALLMAPVITAAGVFILNYRQYPLRFKLHMDTRPLRKIFSYSTYQFLFNFINYFSRNLDKLIIARLFSMAELGYYEKSYRLMMLPMNNITNVVTPVMHPILASFQDDYKQLTDKYHRIVRLLSTVSFPLGVFCYFAAADMIHIVYGDHWDAAVPVFRILALSLPLQMILSTTGAIYQSSGNTKWMFYSGLSNSFCTVTAFISATLFFHRIEAVAWAWTITLVLNTAISYIILYRVVLHQPVTDLIRLCAVPLLTALVLVCTLSILRDSLSALPHVVSLLAVLTLTSVFTFLTAWITYRNKLFLFLKSYKDKFTAD